MRKIEYYHENPIDNILYIFVEQLSPLLKKLNFTPNIITLLSFITALVSLRYFNYQQNVVGSIWFVISYFLDCVDGYYARRYNMVTEFGDYFDHFTDAILSIGLMYQLYKQNSKKAWVGKMTICLAFYAMMMVHFGCQEQIYQGDDNTSSPTLAFTKKLCACKSWINYSRYVGSGTMALVVILLFLF